MLFWKYLKSRFFEWDFFCGPGCGNSIGFRWRRTRVRHNFIEFLLKRRLPWLK
jgi:hypothetical protein